MKRTRLKPVGRRTLRERPEYVEAVTVVRERAENNCERCGDNLTSCGGVIHHIRKRSLCGGHAPSNLAFLCYHCHNLIHTAADASPRGDSLCPDWRRWLRVTAERKT